MSDGPSEDSASKVTRTIDLPDLAATEGLGAALAPHCQKGDVIFLIGDLGAGKTSLARGFVRHFFSNPTLDVPSPSYLLQFSYRDEGSEQGAAGEGGHGMSFRGGRFASLPGVAVHHLDLYRLKAGKIAALVNFEEIWQNDISLIEWPGLLGEQLCSATSPARLEVELSGSGPQGGSRQATIRAVGDRWTSVLASLDLSPLVTEDRGDNQAAGAATVVSLNAVPSGELIPADKMDSMIVLGIESSCDDTGAAVVRADGTIMGEALASQANIHEQWGGVVPNLARAAHAAAIDATVDQAIAAAGIGPGEFDAVAVTVGPGLAPCLQVGVLKAYELAAEYQIPIVRVHHMEAHAFVTRIPRGPDQPPPPDFPYATVLVSGGHNMVLLTKGLGDHTILGSTLDDSIGESFDKTARLLGITQVPGGPHLEKMAAGGDSKAYTLPRPLVNSKDQNLRKGCDFSFSGLKTSTRMLVQKELNDQLSAEERLAVSANLAASFQATAVAHLRERVDRAMVWAKEARPDLSAMIVAGGVAANKLVRSTLESVATKHGLQFLVPPGRLCVDNGVMVAWTGVERLRKGLGEKPPSSKEKAALFTEVRPRWVLGPRDARSMLNNREKAPSNKAKRRQENSQGKGDKKQKKNPTC